MAGTLASPLTIASTGTFNRGGRFPSTTTRVGSTFRPSTARVIVAIVLCRMLMRSISSTSPHATHQASAFSRISRASASRFFAVSFLESANPSIGRAGSRITAAAQTGPARGPRPASSTPATYRSESSPQSDPPKRSSSAGSGWAVEFFFGMGSLSTTTPARAPGPRTGVGFVAGRPSGLRGRLSGRPRGASSSP